jgi:hypothetical protein
MKVLKKKRKRARRSSKPFGDRKTSAEYRSLLPRMSNMSKDELREALKQAVINTAAMTIKRK